jgi:hypothetical protein
VIAQLIDARNDADLWAQTYDRDLADVFAIALRKPPFYPLNYGNSDICDFRFSTADCKQRTSVVCAEIASDQVTPAITR